MDKTTLLWVLSALLVMIGLAGIVLPALPGTIFGPFDERIPLQEHTK